MKTLLWVWLCRRQICIIRELVQGLEEAFLLFFNIKWFVSFLHWSDFECRFFCPQFPDDITFMLLLHIPPCSSLLKLNLFCLLCCLKFILWTVEQFFQTIIYSVSFEFCKVLTSVDLASTGQGSSRCCCCCCCRHWHHYKKKKIPRRSNFHFGL